MTHSGDSSDEKERDRAPERSVDSGEDASRDHALARQSHILESITDAYYAVDSEWRFVYLNRRAEELLERSRGQVLGRSIWDVFAPILGTPLEHAYRHAMLSREIASLDYFYRPQQRWYEVHAYPSKAGLAVYFRDINARKLAEAALRESEDRYRTLFNSIDEGFAIIELIFSDDGAPADYRFLETNRVFEQRTGLINPVGRTARELVPDLDEHWFRIYGQVALTGEPIRFVHEAKAMDHRWFDVYACRVGEPNSRKIALLFNDITERRMTEQAVRDSEGRLQLAVEIAQMGSFEIDLATGAVTVNEPGRDIYGLDSTSTTFEHIQSHFHPDDKPAVLAAVEAAFDPAGPGMFEVEQRIFRSDGELRWIRVRGKAFFERTGPARKAVRCVGTYLDMTDRKLAEEALKDADRRKDEFLAVLAHELRNPLAPLRNGLQILRMARHDSAAVAECSAMMDRQLTHMVRLVDDLLDISRVSRNKLNLRRSRILLAGVISDAVDTVRSLLEEKQHELIVQLPPQPVSLDADLTRLSQVFSNLLSNSAKYTPAGGRIWLTAKYTREVVTVTVRDTGIGIPGAALPTIFDMFSQVDRSLESSSSGLGIGLALVKGLVELHGGSVFAHSDGPNAGSTFTVELPRGLIEGESSESAAPQTMRAFGRRILVADDNHDSAATMAMMLKLLGNEVATAYDGAEAVAAAETFRPDVILMDVGMPTLNGYDATRQIRTNRMIQQPVIIALTGWGQDSDRADSREAGCDAHMVKPVSLDDLQRMLTELNPRPAPG